MCDECRSPKFGVTQKHFLFFECFFFYEDQEKDIKHRWATNLIKNKITRLHLKQKYDKLFSFIRVD